jgi:3-deoxy-D-manno-octulosonic-acid transferase
MLKSLAAWLGLPPSPADTPEAPEAPAEAPLIWVQIGPGGTAETVEGALQVLARLRRLRPSLRLRLALPEAAEPVLPEGVERTTLPEDTATATRALLETVKPGLIVLFGNDLPATLITAADRADIRVMLADVFLPPPARRFGGFRQRGLLRRIARILVRDQASLSLLLRQGLDPAQLDVGGALGRPPEPLRCSEAERASMATLTHTRPVWLAAAVPQAEIAAVVAAQEHAQHHAHRMLLILAPDVADDAVALGDALTDAGWAVASRSLEGEPDGEIEIFIADDPAEYGLWYRIAPVTYMGGTLIGAAGHARSPCEPASLGSAVVHGPQTAPFATDYARLDEARAARSIHDQTSLGEAVADLMSPDRAAVLAHNAWAVTSGGAAAADTVARAILREFDTAQTERTR